MAHMTPDEKDRIDIALKRYDSILRYIAYENSVYWTRAQFFLVANSALLALVFSQFGRETPSEVLWSRIVFQIIACVIGGLLTWLWKGVVENGDQWLRHWKEILEYDLESDAFGSINVVRPWEFRTPPDPPLSRARSTRQIARWLVYLFAGAWSIGMFYSILFGLAKGSCWTLFSN